MRAVFIRSCAIVSERVKLAMGGDQDNPNVIEVIDHCLRRVSGWRI